MPQELPFRLTSDVVLDGAGNGAIHFSPSDGYWRVEQVAVIVSSNIKEPEFMAYVNGTFVGGSYSGSRTNDTSFNQRINAQERLSGVWVGGDSGATATMTISGVKVV